MIEFNVQDMTCGHCAATITRAVKTVDPGARIEIDLEAHRVRVESPAATAEAIAAAIRDEGYTPVTAAA